jgi:hypothetical protein
MSEQLERLELDKLEESGRYKYLGFFLEEPDTFTKDEEGELDSKTLGVVVLFFRCNETDVNYYLRNEDVKDVTVDVPYGVFQKHVASFTHNFTITIDDSGEYDIAM